MGDYKEYDWLYEQYVILQKPTTEIGLEVGVSYDTIRRWLKYYDIPRRTSSERAIVALNEERRKKISEVKRKHNPGGFKKGHKRNLGRVQGLEERQMRSIINSLENNPNW